MQITRGLNNLYKTKQVGVKSYYATTMKHDESNSSSSTIRGGDVEGGGDYTREGSDATERPVSSTRTFHTAQHADKVLLFSSPLIK